VQAFALVSRQVTRSAPRKGNAAAQPPGEPEAVFSGGALRAPNGSSDKNAIFIWNANKARRQGQTGKFFPKRFENG
jgi:hypothetical protein